MLPAAVSCLFLTVHTNIQFKNAHGKSNLEKCEVLTATLPRNWVSWDVTLWCWVCGSRHF